MDCKQWSIRTFIEHLQLTPWFHRANLNYCWRRKFSPSVQPLLFCTVSPPASKNSSSYCSLRTEGMLHMQILSLQLQCIVNYMTHMHNFKTVRWYNHFCRNFESVIYKTARSLPWTEQTKAIWVNIRELVSETIFLTGWKCSCSRINITFIEKSLQTLTVPNCNASLKGLIEVVLWYGDVPGVWF